MKVSNKVTLLGAAVASLFATAAFAQIVLPAAGAASGSRVYAREITAPLVLNGAAPILRVDTPLGIGMSASQDRYLRIRLSGATFGAAFAAGAVVNTTTAFANQTIAIGGAINTSEVIVQITAPAAGNQIADAVQIQLPILNVASTAANVTVTYDVHEFLTEAQTGQKVLYSRTGNVARFSPAVSFENNGAALTSTLTATSQFRAINTGSAGFDGVTSARARVGNVVLLTNTSILNPVATVAPFLADGATAATIGAIVNGASTANTLTVNGDFSAANAPANVSLRTAAGEPATAINGNIATIPLAAGVVGATGFAATFIRYDFNGTTSMPESAYTASLALVPNNGFTVPVLGPITTGSLVRDGAVYESPWMSVTPGFISRLFITQTTVANVPYTVVVRNKAGLVTGGTLTGVLESNKQTLINVASLLPATAVAADGPYQASITVNATAASVNGTYVLTTPSGTVSSTALYRAAAR